MRYWIVGHYAQAELQGENRDYLATTCGRDWPVYIVSKS
jgi:hypothetical protein